MTPGLENVALFAHDETDEAGDLRVVVRGTIDGPDVRARFRVLMRADSTADQRRAAWLADASCLHCETTITDPDRSLVVSMDTGPRLACLGACFVESMRRFHPDRAVRAVLQKLGRLRVVR